MNKQLEKRLLLAKQASLEIVKLSAKKRIKILLEIAKELKKHKEEIFEANKKDVEETKQKGKTNAFIERLTLSEKGFAGMLLQLETVAKLDDVLGETIEQRVLKSGIRLKKVRFALGVIAAIYESRPAITVDFAGLCIKSGNAIILKGGSESIHTNRVLIRCIYVALKKCNISSGEVTFLDNASHKMVADMLQRNDLIDVVIARGSFALTTAVAAQTKIAMLYHAAGGARAYVDKSANIQMAIDLVVNAKTQRNSVCNALDCVVVHRDIAREVLTKLAKRDELNNVEIRADNAALQILKQFRNNIRLASDKDFATEFLDAIIAVKVVKNGEEALAFIQKHSHHHTEMVIAKDKKVIKRFIQEIDAAALMINCSSRFNDGGEFGMGAEMGTATGKLHARGPVGIRELTTYKWVAYGNGQVRK